MSLPHDFALSASSLQDYLDCPRRFQLRYVMRVAWPAAEAEPLEEARAHRERGERFHRLVQAYFLGVPPHQVTVTLSDPQLARWWDDFLAHCPRFPQASWLHEVELSLPLKGFRMIARYDALAVEPEGGAHILDWKTYLKRPGRAQLRRRAQTRVYPLVLVEAGMSLGGRPVRPEEVEMIYWFTATPELPERFAYSRDLFQEDLAWAEALVAEIAGQEEGTWPLTEEVGRCQYCVYRSLCDRGVKPGPMDGWEEPDEMEEDLSSLEWGQAQEVAY